MYVQLRNATFHLILESTQDVSEGGNTVSTTQVKTGFNLLKKDK